MRYRFHVFLLLHYLKLYPPQEGLNMTLLGKESNTSRVVKHLAFCAGYLNQKINLIEYYWSQRFAPENTVPHLFGTLVTGCVDSSAHERTRSSFRDVKKQSYSGKHKVHCNKIQVSLIHYND